MTRYDIRPWQPGDEAAIMALFEQSYQRKLSLEFWNWRFKHHPAGDPLIMLAWDGDRLIAHYAASHAPLVVDGSETPSALSMTTMTHPDYRGQGLVETVGHALYEELAGQRFAGVWGFPNTMFHTTLQKKLGWDSICDISMLSLNIAAARVGSTPATAKIVPVTDARFGTVANTALPVDGISSLRSEGILSWRIDKNPINTYTRFVVEAEGELDGYAIIKPYGDTSFDIVDLRAVDHETITALIASIVEYAKSQKVTHLNTWCLNRDMARLALERLGFAATAPVTYMGGCSFNGRLGDGSDVRRWRLTMIDSDLY